MSRRSLGRRLGFAALLAGFGLALALFAVELILRVADPYSYAEDQEVERFARELRDESQRDRRALSSFYLRPGAHIEFLGQSFEINERGYRTPLVDHEKPKDVYRIVVVGDSVPFGWGVAEAECFPRRLETLLNDKPQPFGRARVEVINLSGPGRGLGDYLIVLQDEALKYQPDAIVVPLVFNDVPLQEVEDAAHQRPPQPVLPAFLRASYVARFLHVAWLEFSGHDLHGDYWIGIRTSQKALAAFKVAFELFHQVAGEVPLLLLDTIGEGVGKGVPEIATAADEAGIPRLECFLELSEWPTRWAIRSPKHNHPNAAAHDVYARRLVEWYAQHGW